MNRFYHDVEVMLGFQIGILVKVCWAVLVPVFNLVSLSSLPSAQVVSVEVVFSVVSVCLAVHEGGSDVTTADLFKLIHLGTFTPDLFKLVNLGAAGAPALPLQTCSKLST